MVEGAGVNGTAGPFFVVSAVFEWTRAENLLLESGEGLKFFALPGKVVEALLGSRAVKSQGEFFHGQFRIKFSSCSKPQFRPHQR